MKTITPKELNAILAGLRVLQQCGYPQEFSEEGEMSPEEIDTLCETINGAAFASDPHLGEPIWYDCEASLPDPEQDVLITFMTHFGQTCSVGYVDHDENWYAVADEDGTFDKVREVEPLMWSAFSKPKLSAG
ncbi:hypothetical protein ACXWTF_13045 [Thiomicrolovo sp. ZZH C-3]